MRAKTCAEPALDGENPHLRGVNRSSQPAADTVLEFGRFRVLVRQRQLFAGGMPIDLGTRAFDLLLVLLEADGSLVTKAEILSRVWQGIVVAEENLKVQISGLRKALGDDHHFIRTEFGRGYRFIGAVRSIVTWRACRRAAGWGLRSSLRSLPRRISRPLTRDRQVSRSFRQTF
jgi:DNA-binding winged helix-turn-helix (wHTH) protein